MADVENAVTALEGFKAEARRASGSLNECRLKMHRLQQSVDGAMRGSSNRRLTDLLAPDLAGVAAAQASVRDLLGNLDTYITEMCSSALVQNVAGAIDNLQTEVKKPDRPDHFVGQALVEARPVLHPAVPDWRDVAGAEIGIAVTVALVTDCFRSGWFRHRK